MKKFDKMHIDISKVEIKFCPNPKGNFEELKRDLKEFEKEFWLIENKENTNDTLVEIKSGIYIITVN